MVNTITNMPFKANKDLLNIRPCGTLVMIAKLAIYSDKLTYNLGTINFKGNLS